MTGRITILLLAGALTMLTACQSSPPSGAVIRAHAADPAPANLNLGWSPYENELATAYAGRADWPSTPHGYRLDEVTYYNRIGYEYQISFDRHQGINYNNMNIQSGVWIR
jgi:hypothetical protein